MEKETDRKVRLLDSVTLRSILHAVIESVAFAQKRRSDWIASLPADSTVNHHIVTSKQQQRHTKSFSATFNLTYNHVRLYRRNSGRCPGGAFGPREGWQSKLLCSSLWNQMTDLHCSSIPSSFHYCYHRPSAERWFRLGRSCRRRRRSHPIFR